MTTASITPAAASAGGDPAGDFDRALIADALRLAGLASHEDRVAYLTSHGCALLPAGDDRIALATVMACMQHALGSLARGYERELKASAHAAAVKVITDRPGIAAEIAACRQCGNGEAA